MADLVSQAQSLFTEDIGRKKRQVPVVGRAPLFEELTFTDEQREFCDNDDFCLYDLIVTGVMEVADVTLVASEESTRIQSLISKNFLISQPLATPINVACFGTRSCISLHRAGASSKAAKVLALPDFEKNLVIMAIKKW